MNVSAILPLAYYGLASLLTITSLSQPLFRRVLVVGPVLVLSFLALVEAKRLTWPYGLNSTFASMVVFYLPYSIKLLLLDGESEGGKKPRRMRGFIECYRIWNNPRQLPESSCSPLGEGDNGAAQSKWTKPSFAFAGRQAVRMAALWAFDAQVFQRVLFRAFLTFELQDVSQSMELPSPATFVKMSASQHIFRVVMSVQWLWSAYFFLTFYHSLLSIFFVTVVGFDKPQDWPPLFGSILEGSTIRGFWGRFWHRLTIPTYAYYARLISRKGLGLSENSTGDKTFIAMAIFFFSGVSHSLVGWSMGDAALGRDVFFFVANFAACALETAVYKKLWPVSARVKERSAVSSGSSSTLLGLARTLIFFYIVAPMWMYPKLYAGLAPLMEGSM